MAGSGAIRPLERLSTGSPALDEILGGGLPSRSVSLITGEPGTGKTLLSLSFLLAGARQGEPGVFFGLEETPEQLRWMASSFGWDLPTLEAQGLLSLSYTWPVELSTDRFVDEARRRVEALRARHAVLDGLTGLSVGVPSEQRYKELVYALAKHFRALGITLVLTLEVPELLGAGQLTGHGISSITDNVILLRYLEVAGHLERAISVLKARGVKHQTQLRRLVIASEGLRLGPPFKRLRCVLTGIPVPVESRRVPSAQPKRYGAAR
jgi:circadian clock protein KaiC